MSACFVKSDRWIMMYNSDKGLEEPTCIRIDEIKTIKVKHETTSNQTNYYFLSINDVYYKEYFVVEPEYLYEFVSNITGCKVLSKDEIAKKIREDKKIKHEVMERMSQIGKTDDIFSSDALKSGDALMSFLNGGMFRS